MKLRHRDGIKLSCGTLPPAIEQTPLAIWTGVSVGWPDCCAA